MENANKEHYKVIFSIWDEDVEIIEIGDVYQICIEEYLGHRSINDIMEFLNLIKSKILDKFGIEECQLKTNVEERCLYNSEYMKIYKKYNSYWMYLEHGRKFETIEDIVIYLQDLISQVESIKEVN